MRVEEKIDGLVTSIVSSVAHELLARFMLEREKDGLVLLISCCLVMAMLWTLH